MASDCKFENANSEPLISPSANFEPLSFWMALETCGIHVHSNLNFDQNEIYFKEILILFFYPVFSFILCRFWLYIIRSYLKKSFNIRWWSFKPIRSQPSLQKGRRYVKRDG